MEIQQTAIRHLTTEQEAAVDASVTTQSPETVTTAQEATANTIQSTATATDADESDSETEHEQEVAADTTADPPKPADNSVISTADNKKVKVSLVVGNRERNL